MVEQKDMDSPLLERSGITTNCWATMDTKTLKPTKKDTLHQRQRKNHRQTVGRAQLWQNQIPYLPGGIPHPELENNSTTEVLHRSEGSKPQAGPPSLRNWQQEELLENTAFMASWIWLQDSPQDWRKQKHHSWEGTHKVLYASGPRKKSSDPIKDWARPTY